jgi:5-methyltetrahydrofolate--homocysteine methyltransferase
MMNGQLKSRQTSFVAGSIGPTNRTASMSPDVNDPGYRAVTFDDLRIAYKQVEALIDGGSDLLLVETIFDTLNAKAALCHRRRMNAISIFQSWFQERLLMLRKNSFWANSRSILVSVSHIPLLSVGFNCALGAIYETVTDFVTKILHSMFQHPNAGLPNAFEIRRNTSRKMQSQSKLT